MKGVVLSQKFNPPPVWETRILNISPCRTGKTSFGASIPYAFVYDFERKLPLVPPAGRKCVAGFTPKNITEAIEVMKWLAEEKKSKGDKFPVKMIVFDGLDEWLYDTVIPEMTQRLMSPEEINKEYKDVTDYRASANGSKGWSLVTNTVLGLLAMATQAGFGWVVLGNAKEHKQTRTTPGGTQEITVWRPAMNPALHGAIWRKTFFSMRTSIAVIEKRGEASEITKPDGTTVTVRGPSTKIRLCEAAVSAVPGGDDLVGANIVLPPTLQMPFGEQWSVFEKAYNDAVEAAATGAVPDMTVNLS